MEWCETVEQLSSEALRELQTGLGQKNKQKTKQRKKPEASHSVMLCFGIHTFIH